MPKKKKIIALGVLIGIAIPFCMSFGMVIENINNLQNPLSIESVPVISQIFLMGLTSSMKLYFIISILAAFLLFYLSAQFSQRRMRLITVLLFGVFINLPYIVIRILSDGSLNFPTDQINMILATVIFSLAGSFTSANPNSTDFAISEPDAPGTGINEKSNDVVPGIPQIQTPPIRKRKRKKSKGFWVIPATLLPLLCGLCLVVAGLAVYFSQNISVENIPDFAWSIRINRSLSGKGFEVQQLDVRRDKTDDLLSSLHVLVGLNEKKEYFDYKDVMEAVNLSIFSAMQTSLLPPGKVGKIVVLINDPSIGYRIISVDYDVAHDYFQGKQNRNYFIQHWEFLQSDS